METPKEQRPAGSSRTTCSRFADTPETNAHLGSHANSPDDTAMWLEIGLPRQFERERDAARKLADDLAEALSDLWHHYSLTGAGYEVVESALGLWRASKGDSSENVSCAPTGAFEG